MDIDNIKTIINNAERLAKTDKKAYVAELKRIRKFLIDKKKFIDQLIAIVDSKINSFK